ncbi:MAG: tryptophan synthase subunit alpha [Firmicutes bacterium]|nr:tryptophan synthase subunit alpha [Bacillota bacterium]
MSENTATDSRLQRRFRELRAQNKKGLIIYICAGDPDIHTTFNLVKEISRAGADVIELGIPFSDPLADGPVIQAASTRALASGTNVGKILSLVDSLRYEEDLPEIPLVLMTYLNPIYRYGLAEFVRDAAAAGVDGLIVPDLPAGEEESTALINAMAGLRPSVDLIPLVAPTSTEERIRAAAAIAQGFIYCVSLTGVTGTRDSLSAELEGFIGRVRSLTDKPLAVGFGISRPEHARRVARYADAVIIGSAVVKAIHEATMSMGTGPDALASVRAVVEGFKNAIAAFGQSPPQNSRGLSRNR